MKRRGQFILTSLVVFIACAGIAATYTWFNWSPYGRIVKGESFTGLLLRPRDGHQVISRSTIFNMEKSLGAFLQADESLRRTRLATDLPLFWRCYTPFQKDGRSYVAIAFHHRASVSRRSWLNNPIVSGGGELHWQVLYDTQAASFSRLKSNPPM